MASFFSVRLISEAALAGAITAILWLLVRRDARGAERLARWYEHVAERRLLWTGLAAILPIVVRLALLAVLPVPVPQVHDEFGHLLVADTVLAGRLANPPHPLAAYLESIYVLQHPTYASSYPIGQGLALAAGQALFGHPWAGVLLAAAAMSGAIAWMLYACVPPKWAAAGALLASIHFGLAEPWIDTYWGGALCAFAGALVFGALARLWRAPSAGLALTAGAGWTLVWLIRPFESVFLLCAMWIAIAWRLWGAPRLRQRWARCAALIALTQMLAGFVSLAHNRAVTGSAVTLPYRLSQQVQGVPQTLFVQAPVERPDFPFPEAERMYEWQRKRRDSFARDRWGWLHKVAYEAWSFFVTPWYTAPLLALAVALKDRRVQAMVALLAAAVSVSSLYPFFFPHYLAAYSGILFLLVVRGLMQLSRFTWRSVPIGPAIVTFSVIGAVLMGLRIVPVRVLLGRAEPAPNLRQAVRDHLTSVAGTHVVLVRYGSPHDFDDEWVYNPADVDASPIVWLRWSVEAGDRAAAYYPERQVWVADVEDARVQLARYGGRNGPDLTLTRGVRHSSYPRRW